MSFTFEHVDVKTELVNALKIELPKFGFGSVKVIKADPASPTEIPCIGINRIEDSESEQTISDFAGSHFDSANKKHYKVFGTFFNESVEVRVWHTNADERDRLYRHVKAIMMAQRLLLVEKGLRNITLRAGRDEQDTSMTNAPTALYWSAITMSYMNPLDVTFTELVEPITAIQVNEKFTTGGDLGGNS